MEQEIRFDPDLWQVDIEDSAGRAFVELVLDNHSEQFTYR
jgi:hypothetical protein